MLTRRLFLGISAAFLTVSTRLKALAMTIGVQVTEVVNTVTSKPKDSESPAPVDPGTDLTPDTEIATSRESGAKLTYADTTILIVGQRSRVTVMPDFSAALLTAGAFRFTGPTAENVVLTSPLLRIEARRAEFVVAVAEGQTICGVVAGEITCTSIKKGTAAKVGAGESIAWISGSFGDGVTPGVYQTGDIAVDQSLDAARAAWAPVAAPPPAPQ
ncbi:MAG: FecR domain-containing protein [Micropepsaceae bacterium]